MNIVDQDGDELVTRLRRFAQFMPEVFAVDADGSRGGIAKESSKPKSGYSIPKESSKAKIGR